MSAAASGVVVVVIIEVVVALENVVGQRLVVDFRLRRLRGSLEAEDKRWKHSKLDTSSGSGCSTAVEHTPRDREVVAFFSSLPYPMKCLRNQVPRGGATLLIFLFKNIHA